jgi:hypothetical protein
VIFFIRGRWAEAVGRRVLAVIIPLATIALFVINPMLGLLIGIPLVLWLVRIVLSARLSDPSRQAAIAPIVAKVMDDQRRAAIRLKSPAERTDVEQAWYEAELRRTGAADAQDRAPRD